MTATITRLSVGLRPAAKIEQPVDDGRRRVAHRGTLCRVSVEVIARAELVRRAGSTAAARRLVGDGDWVRVLRNAYVPRGTPDGIPARAAALRLVLPSDVAVAGRAALWLVGVPLLDEVVDVVIPRGRHLVARPGVRARAALLPDEELCEVDGLLVVSAARAVVDVARQEALVEAAVVGDAALRAGVARLDGVRACLDRARGLRGVEAARVCVQHVEPRSESPMETRLRVKLVVAGLRGLEVQRDLYDEHGHVGRGDLYVDGVVVEFDGRAARLDPAVFVAERRRQVRIAELGLELRRYTAPDVYSRSGADLRAELERAQRLARGRTAGLLRGPDTLRPPRLRPLPVLADLRRAA